VPDSGGTLLLMLCSGAALPIVRRFAFVQSRAGKEQFIPARSPAVSIR